MQPPSTVHIDVDLRNRLLECYLEAATSPELTDWLRGLGGDGRGTVDEKRQRIRESTAYLGMPVAEFPEQTARYLDPLPVEYLRDICAALELNNEGPRDSLFRRIMREARYREGWTPKPESRAPAAWTVAAVRPFVECYPIAKRGRLERDFYDAFEDEMAEVFGDENVHQQLAIAYGNALRIDFHLGHPQGDGVGVELKMPKTNGDIQRAIGQLDQYRERYADRLLFVLFPDFMDSAAERLLTDQLQAKAIGYVVK